MKIYSETTLREFSFWAGAVDTAKYLSTTQLDTVENILEDVYSDGVSDTEINDLFWFDEDLIAEWLGYTDFEELKKDSIPWD